MKPRSIIIQIENWIFNPAKRAHRFRCQGCDKVITDHSAIVIERRGKSSHGYHAACFDTSPAGEAARARDAEQLNRNRDKLRYA